MRRDTGDDEILISSPAFFWKNLSIWFLLWKIVVEQLLSGDDRNKHLLEGLLGVVEGSMCMYPDKGHNSPMPTRVNLTYSGFLRKALKGTEWTAPDLRDQLARILKEGIKPEEDASLISLLEKLYNVADVNHWQARS